MYDPNTLYIFKAQLLLKPNVGARWKNLLITRGCLKFLPLISRYPLYFLIGFYCQCGGCNLAGTGQLSEGARVRGHRGKARSTGPDRMTR